MNSSLLVWVEIAVIVDKHEQAFLFGTFAKSQLKATQTCIHLALVSVFSSEKVSTSLSFVLMLFYYIEIHRNMFLYFFSDVFVF